MSSDYVYTMYRADKFYGPDRQVLANISLSFLPGAKIGVLGPNGAGKSTLLRIMAGKEEPSSGVARARARRDRRPARAGAASSTRRRTCAATSRTASASCATCSTASTRSRRAFAEPDADYDTLLAEQAKVQDAIDRARRLGARRRTLDHAMDALRLPGRRPRRRRRSPAASGAASRSAGCCSPSPDLLLLDEPTNHLDAESVAWLERFLADYKGTVVAVTHDRYFLDNVAGWILELDRGRGIPFQGNYSSWLEQKQERLARRGEDRSRRAAARSRASSSGCA